MSTEQSVIRHSYLVNQLVLDRRTAEELGRVDHLWLNPQIHQVVGFTCKSGFMGGKKQRFAWRQIESIGEHSILVNFNPEEFSDPEKPDEIYPLIGHEVWTDTGNKVGKVVDYLLDTATGAVINYLFASSGWRGILDGLYLLPIAEICSIGSKRLIVQEATFKEPQFYAEGLNQKVSQVREFFQGDLEETKRHLGSIAKGAQGFAQQAKDKAKEITKQAQTNISEEREKSDAALPPAPDLIELNAELVTEETKEQEKG